MRKTRYHGAESLMWHDTVVPELQVRTVVMHSLRAIDNRHMRTLPTAGLLRIIAVRPVNMQSEARDVSGVAMMDGRVSRGTRLNKQENPPDSRA